MFLNKNTTQTISRMTKFVLLQNSTNISLKIRSHLASINVSTISCRGCSIVREKLPPAERKTDSKKENTLKLNPQNENERMLKEIVASLKEKRAKKSSYLFKEKIAERLVDRILQHRLNPKAPMFEIGPGIGVVSKKFLNRGIEQVIAAESEKIFNPHLQSIQQEYGSDRFEFYNWNILNIYDKFNDYSPKENGLSYKETEMAVTNRLAESAFSNADAPYSFFTIGGSLENQNFIFYIVRNLPNEDPILSKGRVEFFFLAHPRFKLSIEGIIPTDKPSKYTRSYSYFHSLLCLFYDIVFIEDFEATDFVPAFSKNSLTKKANAHKRHLVKMQLKEDIAKILPLDHHYAFSIFLRHLFRKRKLRIVPVMEMLVSGCGLQMLMGGFTMMETVADVTPQRLLHLYKSMLTWPEYSASHLSNHIIMKTQGGPLDDEDM